MQNYACPSCKKNLLFTDNKKTNIICSNAKCNYSKKPFLVKSEIPILIPFENEYCILKRKIQKSFTNYGSQKRTLKTNKFLNNKLKKKLKQFFVGENKYSKDNYKFLSEKLKPNKKILIIGGGIKGEGSSIFYRECKRQKINMEIIDIYISKECTVVADAHYLPYKDDYFDLIIIQAVLEHLAFPNIAVKELERVLKVNGIIFSDVPFIQNVHEGSYDFTRFTHSGHRLLFKEFNEIKSGVNQGAFSSCLFILSNTISSFSRVKMLGPLTRLLFSRVAKFLDKILSNKDNIDIACGTFLICYKPKKSFRKKNYKWIVDYYQGNQD